KYHPVDSSEMSFKMAGSLAFKEAAAKAGVMLLEPVSRVEVTVPQSLQGDVLGDLNTRRGRVQATEVDAQGSQVIVALVPAAEALRYAVDLRSLTAGRGRFSMVHDHYDVLPSHLADRVPKRASG
ncbi:MAG: elongation factor G, partial [Acidimicrobiales bacterium]